MFMFAFPYISESPHFFFNLFLFRFSTLITKTRNLDFKIFFKFYKQILQCITHKKNIDVPENLV